MDGEFRGLHRFLPGIGLVFFLALLPALFSHPSGMLVDPAAGRHLAAGRLILAQGAPLHQDPFSWTRPGAPWITFEWLFEALAASLERWGGLPLVVWTLFCLGALLPVLWWRQLMRHRISVPTAFLLVMAVTLLFGGHRSVRPYLFTYVFLQLVVSWWRERHVPGVWEWLLLPVIMAFWANLHGGFAAAFLFLGASLAGRILDEGGLAPLRAPWRKNWVVLLAVAALATLLNPHGWDLHKKVMEMTLRMKSFAFWNEFMSPDFASGSTLALAVLTVVFVLIFVPPGAEESRKRWELHLPLLVFLYFALKSQRHVFLLMIVALVPLARRFEFLRKKMRCPDWFASMSGFRGECWLVPVLSVLLWFPFRNSAGSGGLRVGEANLKPGALEFVREHMAGRPHPLTTTWNAGALLYYLHPPFRVAFDDRTDFYGDAFNFRILRLLRARPGWERLLEEDGYDSAILEKGEPLAQLLPLTPGWREVYSDSLTVIFFRE